jgi:hypothetical protein
MSLKEKVKMAFKLAYDIKKAVQQTEGVREVEVKVTAYNRADELMEVLKEVGGQQKEVA